MEVLLPRYIDGRRRRRRRRKGRKGEQKMLLSNFYGADIYGK
jgi:hypothetical protein